MSPADLIAPGHEAMSPLPGTPAGLEHRFCSSFLLAYQPIVSATHPHPVTWHGAAGRILDLDGSEKGVEDLRDRSAALDTEIDKLSLLQAYEDLVAYPWLRVSLKVGPAALRDPAWQAGFALLSMHRDIATRVMIEITLRDSSGDNDDVIARLVANRTRGIRLALGSNTARSEDLETITRIKPDLIRIRPEMLADIAQMTHVRTIAQPFNARLVMSDVDTPDMIAAARKQGVAYLQGRVFGDPAFLHD